MQTYIFPLRKKNPPRKHILQGDLGLQTWAQGLRQFKVVSLLWISFFWWWVRRVFSFSSGDVPSQLVWLSLNLHTIMTMWYDCDFAMNEMSLCSFLLIIEIVFIFITSENSVILYVLKKNLATNGPWATALIRYSALLVRRNCWWEWRGVIAWRTIWYLLKYIFIKFVQ